MKCLTAILLILFSFTGLCQQAPSAEELLKQLQKHDVLPVRKGTQLYFAGATFISKNGKVIIDTSFHLPLSPLRSLYTTESDDGQLSDLASSVKAYLADLKNKKP